MRILQYNFESCVFIYINSKLLSMKQNYSFFGEKLSPKDSTIRNILNFSKTLSVIRSGVLKKNIVCFKN